VLHKDVVIALLGASATIAGLVLVFLGLVVSAYDALGTAVPPGAKKPLQFKARLLLAPFALSLVQILAGAFWFRLQCGWLYELAFWLFITTIAALFIGAAATLWRVVWG
jgi:hypothetical protein